MHLCFKSQALNWKSKRKEVSGPARPGLRYVFVPGLRHVCCSSRRPPQFPRYDSPKIFPKTHCSAMRPAAISVAATAAALRVAFLAPPAAAFCLLPPRRVFLLPLHRISSSSSPAAPPCAASSDSQPPPLPAFMDAQFESFRAQLDGSSALRDRIRAIVSEVESASRAASAALLLIHQPVPLSGCWPLFLLPFLFGFWFSLLNPKLSLLLVQMCSARRRRRLR